MALLMIVSVISYFQYGGTITPIDTNADVLKTVNPAMDKGISHASVKMVEYADLLCPYCSEFANTTMPLIEHDFVDCGKVQVEFRPVAVIAPNAERVAEGA